MSIDLYGLRLSAPCRAVMMTGRQLGLDLNIKNVDLSEGKQLEPEYLKLNPGHTVPTIVDGDLVLWESRAIMQYLCNQYAPDSSLYPKDPKKRAIVDRWLNFDLSFYRTQGEALRSKLFFGIEPTEDQLNAYKNSLKLLDSLIGDNKYITGNDLTIADLTLLATASFIETFETGIDLNEYPNFKRWLSSITKELSYYEEINKIDKKEIFSFLEKFKTRMAAEKAK